MLGLVEEVEFVDDNVGILVRVVSRLTEVGVGVREWSHRVFFWLVFRELYCILFEFSRSIAFFVFIRFG